MLGSGCASDSSPQQGPTLSASNRALFDQALNSNLSAKQAAILGDYWVTDEEWFELVDDFHACLAPSGIEGWVAPTQARVNLSDAHLAKLNREYDDPMQQMNEDFEVLLACADQHLMMIGTLYFEPRSNPDGVSHWEALRRCYAKHGLADLDGIPEDQIEDFVNSPDYDQFNPPQRAECLANPSYGDYW